MDINRRTVFTVAGFALILTLGLALANRGTYGWTLFILLPVIAGGIGALAFRPASAWGAAGTGAIIGALGCGIFLILGAEGFICVMMSIPVVVPLAVAGSLFVYWGTGSSRTKRPAGMALLLPFTMLFDVSATPPVYPVTTSIVVKATPDRVWRNVVEFPEITAEPDWILRTGVAYPLRTRIEGSGPGVRRTCELSTGNVEERVTVWDEPRQLRFAVTATPPAMKEMGLYGEIHPRHLDGYYISKQGQFELTPLAGGRTLVVGKSWYQHGLWPAAYWRVWTDTVVHHIHLRVLEHIRVLSEGGQ